jgi:hypothetical protein
VDIAGTKMRRLAVRPSWISHDSKRTRKWQRIVAILTGAAEHEKVGFRAEL